MRYIRIAENFEEIVMKRNVKLFICVGAILFGSGAAVLAGAPYGRNKNHLIKAHVPAPVKEYGISTTLTGTDCYLDRLDELKNDGITHVEICLRENYDEADALFGKAVEQIKASGLKIWSVHLPFGDTVNPAEPEEEKRIKNIEKIKKFIFLTEGCGAKIFVIHGSYEPVVQDAQRMRVLDAAVVSLAELNGLMNEKKLKLAVENLPRTCIGNNIDEMDYIAEKIPDLSFCFDTNHFTPAKPNENFKPIQRLIPSLREKMNPVNSDPVAFAHKFANRIITVHISDYDGINECHWIPGQGIIAFQSIHNTLIFAGFDAPIMFEPNEKCKGVKTTGKRLIEGYEKTLGIR